MQKGDPTSYAGRPEGAPPLSNSQSIGPRRGLNQSPQSTSLRVGAGATMAYPATTTRKRRLTPRPPLHEGEKQPCLSVGGFAETQADVVNRVRWFASFLKTVTLRYMPQAASKPNRVLVGWALMAVGLIKIGRGGVLTVRLRGMCGVCGLKRAWVVLSEFIASWKISKNFKK